MSTTSSPTATASRWKRPAYLLLVVAVLAAVMLAWFRTPTATVASDGAGNENLTLRCANAGPSRWDPPAVDRGQDLSSDPAPAMLTHNQQVLKNDIESLRAELACGAARDAHQNTLIVMTFGAGTALFFGYWALWARRTFPEEPTQHA